MKINFIKKNGALYPMFDDDMEKFKRIRDGATFIREFKKVRNPKFHGLVFGFLNWVFKFQDKFNNFDKFRKRLTLYAGYYKEEIIMHKGNAKALIEVDSLKFDRMDEYEYQKFYSDAKNAALEHFIPRTNPEEIIKLENELLSRFD